jgi:hypothetical protein
MIYVNIELKVHKLLLDYTIVKYLNAHAKVKDT